MDVLDLDAFIASLEADAARLVGEAQLVDQRLAMARDLRATYPTPAPEPVVVAPPSTAPAAPEATPSKPKASKVAPSKRVGNQAPDYVPIAAAILEARALGVAVGAFVAERFNVPKTTVTNWVTKCTKLGLLDKPESSPAPKLAVVPEPKTAPPASTHSVSDGGSRTVYRCGSDDLEFTSIIDLTHHTLTDHDRRPTAAEKILVTPDSARSSA